MTVTQPMRRVKYAGTEVDRLRLDAQEWKGDHDALTEDRWLWVDLISRANHIHGRIIDLDLEIQGLILNRQIAFDPALNSAVQDLLQRWRDAGLQILPRVERLERELGSVEGAAGFRDNLAEASLMLTPDREFFGGEGLARLRDQAIDDHRAGRTEPVHVNGSAEAE